MQVLEQIGDASTADFDARLKTRWDTRICWHENSIGIMLVRCPDDWCRPWPAGRAVPEDGRGPTQWVPNQEGLQWFPKRPRSARGKRRPSRGSVAMAWPEAWLQVQLCGTRLPMRAYAGTVDQVGLRWFLPEEVLPRDLLRHTVRADLTRSTTAVWALVADEDAEAIRADLSAGHPRAACNLLLNRAVELLTLLSGSPDLAG